MTLDAGRPLSDADDAFAPIYRRYATDVYRYSLALLGNPSDAEDATQTAFLNAYRAYRRGERPREPLNWLIVIAHNACLERRRRAQRRPEEVPLDGEARAAQALDADQTHEVRELLDALAKLPFGQRAALVLREVGGRSYEEIAELLGTSVKGVDMALMRARRALRRRRASLGALTAVEAPAHLSAPTTSGALAQAAFGLGPLPLATKVAAAVVVGAVAAVPLTETLRETRALQAPPLVDRALASTNGVAAGRTDGGAAGARVGTSQRATSALARAARAVRRMPDAAGAPRGGRAATDDDSQTGAGTNGAPARGGSESGSPSAVSGPAVSERGAGDEPSGPAGSAAPSQGGAQDAGAAPPTQASSSATAPVQQAAAPATETVQTTTTTVTAALPAPSPSVAVPTAPVAAPSAPVSSPVSVPSVQPPSLPSVPTVSVPTLPPPPPPPSLPPLSP